MALFLLIGFTHALLNINIYWKKRFDILEKQMLKNGVW